MDSSSSIIPKFKFYSTEGILLVKQKRISLTFTKKRGKRMFTGPSSSYKALFSRDCSSLIQVLGPSCKPATEHDTVNTWSQAKTKALSLGTENK